MYYKRILYIVSLWLILFIQFCWCFQYVSPYLPHIKKDLGAVTIKSIVQKDWFMRCVRTEGALRAQKDENFLVNNLPKDMPLENMSPEYSRWFPMEEEMAKTCVFSKCHYFLSLTSKEFFLSNSVGIGGLRVKSEVSLWTFLSFGRFLKWFS